MSKLRFRVVEKAFQTKPLEVTAPSERPSEYIAMFASAISCSSICLLLFTASW